MFLTFQTARSVLVFQELLVRGKDLQHGLTMWHMESKSVMWQRQPGLQIVLYIEVSAAI